MPLIRQPAEGLRFVELFVNQVRASGGFRVGTPDCPGPDIVARLRAAFRRVGYDLDPEGNLRPTVLENLDGIEMTEALSAYVRRAQLGSSDAELLIGTAKNLEEATVRHVLKEITGEYATSGRAAHFPTALFQAFYALDLAGSKAELDKDPYRALQQALFLLACAVNRLRNDRGDGHGRPEPSVATALQGRLSTQSAGLGVRAAVNGAQNEATIAGPRRPRRRIRSRDAGGLGPRASSGPIDHARRPASHRLRPRGAPYRGLP